MAKNDNLTDFLTDVANAIRQKKGTNEPINPQDFSSEIASIQTGGGENKLPQLIDRSITEITADDLSGITSIGSNGFYNCTNLSLTSLPSEITSIGGYAFGSCTRLTSITFEGTPQTINSSAFKGCTNLTTINVPWAEGKVGIAPWGAENATINYNYTGR